MRGVKPAMAASVRMTSSSAVLRELPIQSWSRNRAKVWSVVVPGAIWLAGTPRPHGAVHSGVLCMAGSVTAGARL
jgi:hypothetical protein